LETQTGSIREKTPPSLFSRAIEKGDYKNLPSLFPKAVSFLPHRKFNAMMKLNVLAPQIYVNVENVCFQYILITNKLRFVHACNLKSCNNNSVKKRKDNNYLKPCNKWRLPPNYIKKTHTHKN
jgi:hypothetical protein